MQCQAAGQNITEFLSFMRIIRYTGSSCVQCHENRFHTVLLRGGNDPLDRIVQFLILFFKIICAGKNNLFFSGFIEKISQVGTEALQNIV